MAWQILAQLDTQHPAAVRLAIAGTDKASIEVWRVNRATGERARVRGISVMTSSLMNVYDTEALLDATAVYQVVAAGRVVAESGTVYCLPVLDPDGTPSGRPVVIRNVLAPLIRYTTCRIYDETDIRRASRTSLFDVIGRAAPIAVGDEHRLESSVMAFVADSMRHCDQIISVFQPGEPVLIRTPCESLIRSKIVVGMAYREERRGKDGTRFAIFDVQTIGWPEDAPEAPTVPPGAWVYQTLKDQAPLHAAATYADLAPQRSDYFDLAMRPIA